MKSYSEDLRQRIVRAVADEGMSQPEVARRFAVGVRSVERYLARWRATGSLAAGRAPGAAPPLPRRSPPCSWPNW